ncbi:2-oxo-4-hydroxy-4-carboxy-5-ureidoimidazoline decarboxylase [Streptomyces sp. NPDC055078]
MPSPQSPQSPASPPGRSPEPVAGLARFDAPADTDLIAALHEVCAGRAWVSGVLDRGPYATTAALLAASDAATAGLTTGELLEAMAGHPPIGRPEPGDPVSAGEQSGLAGSPDGLKAELLELNLAYQRRFGHVFLICATGLTGEQMRDAVRVRIRNSPEREREIARTELGRINRIRLARFITERLGLPAPPEASASAAAQRRDREEGLMSTETIASVSTHILDTTIGRPAAGVAVALSARSDSGAAWAALGGSTTDADGRCADLPALPAETTQVRLDFRTGPYLAGADHQAPGGREGGAFFPEVAVTFAVVAGEHYHVPLLLNPYGYSVYRGS